MNRSSNMDLLMHGSHGSHGSGQAGPKASGMRRVSVLTVAVVAAIAGLVTLGPTAPAGASAPTVPGYLDVIAGPSGLSDPGGVAVDSSGNVYIADTNNNRIEKVTPAGTMSTFAGTGTPGAPTAGAATASMLWYPSGVTVDSSGNVYIADFSNQRIEKVTPAGTLSFFAGTGSKGHATEGAATSSKLSNPRGVTVDSSGNVYIAEGLRIDKVTPAGTLSFFAGTGVLGAPTAGPATSSNIGMPISVAADGFGNVYVADKSYSEVEKITSSGTLSIFAGTGTPGAPTAGPATSSMLYLPAGVGVDSSGNVYIADYDNQRVEEVTPAGTLSFFAGTGIAGAPTAGPATSSMLSGPDGVAVDSMGNVYIADCLNQMIEEVKGPSMGVPGPPTGVSALVGYDTAIVSFVAPTDSGWSPITGYTVVAIDSTTSVNGGQTCAATDPTDTCTVVGLTVGDAYTFTATATNASGDGYVSAHSNSVTPAGLPGTASNVTATAGDASAAVSWTAAYDNGATVTNYTVTSSPDGLTCSTATTSCSVTGLTNESSYTFTVVATNAIGPGLISAPSNSVTPMAPPQIASNVTATAGNASAIVSWTAAPSNGATVTGYTVTSSPQGLTCTTAATSCSVTGLTNDSAYTFTVTATSSVGTGLPSAASNSVVPSSNTAGITSANSTTIAGGKGLKFLVTTSGTPTATVSQTGMASWMTLTLGAKSKSGTAVLGGTSPSGGGTFTVTIHANNGVGPDTIQVLTVHVLAFTSISTASFTKGVYGSFTITTSDSAAILSATLSASKEAGLSFTNNGDGTATVSGTPGSAAKTASVTVTATVGSIKVKQKLTVSIN